VRALLRPVTSWSTWARVLHLAIGLWFAVACALVWPGLPDASPRSLAGLFLAPLPLLAVLACVPAVRRSEGVQARALLLPGDDQITMESSRTWSDRGRLLGWLIVRVELGVLAGQLAALAATTTWSLVHSTAREAPDVPDWAAGPLALAALAAAVYALAGLGALSAAVARRLLHPSLAERLAAQQARTERLLERTRLAAELHDSIGHALTVTVLQAGAARELAGRDPAFVDRALAAIEDSARQAAADLDRVLALLRRESSPAPDAPTLADVDGLVRAAEAAGATVDAELIGAASDLPQTLSREAYRMVQEALTNALRHAGPVPIRLRITVDRDAVHVAVDNPLPTLTAATGRPGSGVRGLHERAAVLGGTAQAGPVADQWRVTVRLPLPGAA
jgi:signal transduction histidine kinase